MRMLTFATAAAFALLATACDTQSPSSSPGTDATATTCVKVDESRIADLFTRWNETLRTGSPEQVAALYAEDAVLLPTVSDTPRYTPDARIDYFEHFQAKHPSGHIDERRIRIGCNMALDSGIYTFTFDDGTKVQARYSFAYTHDGTRWQIASHHSSAMPEGGANPNPH